MNEQTNEWGRRLEDLYDACMKLTPDRRDGFIQAHAYDDPELARQLRRMIRLEDPEAANPLIDQKISQDTAGFEFTSDTDFGNCRIINGHGAGAMGTVYLARDLMNHQRTVALKVMKPNLLRKEDQQRFSDETSALSRLSHPNIARLYFSGVQSWHGVDRPFLVMEFVDGLTLDQYLQLNNISPRQLLELLRKIALAVHHGHLQGVFHRDLKPTNILVTREGEPKLVDFGVSFTISTRAAPGKQTTLQENVGTTQYMAPEVAGALQYRPDARTDVYSLGIIAFEVFAGRRPGVQLESGRIELLQYPLTDNQIRRLICDCERECLRRVDRHLSSDLECVIAKALQRTIGQRYSDAAELAEDFRRLIHLEPINARPSSQLYIARMFALRNRIAVTAAVLVFAAISSTAVIFRIDQTRVQSALVQKSAALESEAAARRVAIQRGDEIQQKNAAAHARSAELAEQRGNWVAAAEEYRLAEDAGFPDRLKLMVGELRAFDRSDRPTDANALIERVQKSFPKIANAPAFEMVQGFFCWCSRPGDSLKLIESALANSHELDPADRAFGQALITDDVNAAAAKLRETVENDPFNHDAFALLALCDLAQGDARKCEQDAGVMQRLYPGDGSGAVLAAVGSAFQGRREAAIAYLQNNGSIPPGVKATLIQTAGSIADIHSIDDLRSFSSISALSQVTNLYATAGVVAGPRAIPIPHTFSRLMEGATPTSLMGLLLNRQRILEVAAKWPNGDGELAAGWLDIKRGDYASADGHLRAALSEPALFDCRRNAALLLAITHATDYRRRHVPNAEVVHLIKTDLDKVISLGGSYPEKSPEETLIITIAIVYDLYPQVRTLALEWLSRAPDDPGALYCLAVADSKLDDRDTAQAIFKRALAKGLSGTMKTDAQARLRELSGDAAASSAR